MAVNKKLDQRKTPFVDAVKEYTSKEVIPFDVPGHHMGNIDNPAVELLGRNVYHQDINAPIGLDNLARPKGVLLEAEQLMADAMGADEAFFLINGTSSGIITMIMTACKAGEKIILPRNVHKSVINALIVSGAIPVYVMPAIDLDLEIANQPRVEDYKKAILHHPSAKAIFVINPTYFGGVGDLASIVELAHEHNMAVLVDEAHGAHFYFHAEGSPLTAMDAGADMSAVSIHKTAGSLTQSSVLLLRNGIYNRYDVQKTLNILNTTSPSSLLLASLDGARQFMATKGKKAQEKTYELVAKAAHAISRIPGFYVCGRSHFISHGCYDYDKSKLVIGLDHLDIDGFALYYEIKRDYGIQLELAETYAVLCVFAIGNNLDHVHALIHAFKELSKKHYKKNKKDIDHHFDAKFPYALLRPRNAFQPASKIVPLEECDGLISKEQVMIYPPGIPLICPGEIWNRELIRRVKRYIASGITLLSSYPDGFEVVDNDNWKRYPIYKKRIDDYRSMLKTTPFLDGYSMPFEGGEHEATVILLPYRNDTWRDNAIPAQKNYKEVISAIAEHEKVIVGMLPHLYDQLKDEYLAIPNVKPIKIRYNDAWARDNMSIFLTNGHDLRAVDFRFNAWGGDYDGLYDDYKWDDRLSATFDKKFKIVDYQHPSFVLEGGSIAVDGQGTLITTEACLLSPGRNPTLSKLEIEENLKEYLGVEKVIWVPHGIYLDETDEHIDNMVAFIRPGVVALAWTNDKNDPQWEYCHETYKALKKATDAKGRKLEIVKILVPSPALTMNEDEASGISRGRHEAKARLNGSRLSASYVNFYQGKDFVILPQFGVKEDKLALKQMEELFPNKKIHAINTREILLGGGNVHCITQQIPLVDKRR